MYYLFQNGFIKVTLAFTLFFVVAAGIASGNKCISILEVLSYVFFVLLTIATIIAFGLVMNLYLHIKGIQERRAGFLLRRSSEGDKLKMQNLDMRKNRPIKPRDPSFD